MSKADLSAVSGGGRSPGRPPGPASSSVLIRLSEDERAFAGDLGNGVYAKGIRRAIKAAGILGVEAVVRLAGPDDSEDDVNAVRGPGRPRIGKPTSFKLTEDEIKIADSMGLVKQKTFTSVGVRRAIRACSHLGVDAALRLAS